MNPPSIAKNTAFITLASILQRVISVTYFILVARQVSEVELGWYSVALATTTMFVVLVDIGLTNVLIRESAREEEKTQTYFSNSLMMKLGLGVLSYFGLVVFTYLMGYTAELRLLTLVSGMTMLIDSYQLTVYGVLRAKGILLYESIGVVVSQGITLLLGAFFLWQGFPLVFLILAFTCASCVNATYATLMLRRHGVRLKLLYQPHVMKPLLVIALPFALAAIFNRVYANADLLIVHRVLGEEAAAWYTTPYKIVTAFQFIPLALTSAIYPRFSEFFVKNKEKLTKIFEQSVLYLLLLSTPMAVGIAVLAHDIIVLVFSERYVASVLPLQIIIFSIIFTFLTYPLGALLNACNRQIRQTIFVGVVMVCNVVLNIIFVPLFGIIGAAGVALFSSVLMVILSATMVRNILGVRLGYVWRKILLIIVSAVIMGLVVFVMNEVFPLLVTILAGAVVYAGSLLLFRVLSMEQVKDILLLFRNRDIVT